MSLLPRLTVSFLAAAVIAAGSVAPAAAAPKSTGGTKGDAKPAPASAAYDAHRPAGGDTGRKIG